MAIWTKVIINIILIFGLYFHLKNMKDEFKKMLMLLNISEDKTDVVVKMI